MKEQPQAKSFPSVVEVVVYYVVTLIAVSSAAFPLDFLDSGR